MGPWDQKSQSYERVSELWWMLTDVNGGFGLVGADASHRLAGDLRHCCGEETTHDRTYTRGLDGRMEGQ